MTAINKRCQTTWFNISHATVLAGRTLLWMMKRSGVPHVCKSNGKNMCPFGVCLNDPLYKHKIVVVRETGYIIFLETLRGRHKGTRFPAAKTMVSMATLAFLSMGPFLFLAPVTSQVMFPEVGRKGNAIFFGGGTRLAQLRGLNTGPRALVQKC